MATAAQAGCIKVILNFEFLILNWGSRQLIAVSVESIAINSLLKNAWIFRIYPHSIFHTNTHTCTY